MRGYIFIHQNLFFISLSLKTYHSLEHLANRIPKCLSRMCLRALLRQLKVARQSLQTKLKTFRSFSIEFILYIYIYIYIYVGHMSWVFTSEYSTILSRDRFIRSISRDFYRWKKRNIALLHYNKNRSDF